MSLAIDFIPGFSSGSMAYDLSKSWSELPSQPSLTTRGNKVLPVSISIFAELSIWTYPLTFGNCFKATLIPWNSGLRPHLLASLTSASHTKAIPPLPRRSSFLYPTGHLSPYFSFSDGSKTWAAGGLFGTLTFWPRALPPGTPYILVIGVFCCRPEPVNCLATDVFVLLVMLPKAWPRTLDCLSTRATGL